VIPCKSPYPIRASSETPDHADDLGYRILYLDAASRAPARTAGREKCGNLDVDHGELR
jgi:hypothetical protein